MSSALEMGPCLAFLWYSLLVAGCISASIVYSVYLSVSSLVGSRFRQRVGCLITDGRDLYHAKFDQPSFYRSGRANSSGFGRKPSRAGRAVAVLLHTAALLLCVRTRRNFISCSLPFLFDCAPPTASMRPPFLMYDSFIISMVWRPLLGS